MNIGEDLLGGCSVCDAYRKAEKTVDLTPIRCPRCGCCLVQGEYFSTFVETLVVGEDNGPEPQVFEKIQALQCPECNLHMKVSFTPIIYNANHSIHYYRPKWMSDEDYAQFLTRHPHIRT